MAALPRRLLDRENARLPFRIDSRRLSKPLAERQGGQILAIQAGRRTGRPAKPAAGNRAVLHYTLHGRRAVIQHDAGIGQKRDLGIPAGVFLPILYQLPAIPPVPVFGRVPTLPNPYRQSIRRLVPAETIHIQRQFHQPFPSANGLAGRIGQPVQSAAEKETMAAGF